MPGCRQALLLNYPPAPTANDFSNWEKNYKSNMHEGKRRESNPGLPRSNAIRPTSAHVPMA